MGCRIWISAEGPPVLSNLARGPRTRGTPGLSVTTITEVSVDISTMSCPAHVQRRLVFSGFGVLNVHSGGSPARSAYSSLAGRCICACICVYRSYHPGTSQCARRARLPRPSRATPKSAGIPPSATSTRAASQAKGHCAYATPSPLGYTHWP